MVLMEYTIRIKDVSPQQLVLARRKCSWAEWGAAIESLLRDVWARLNQLDSVTVGPAMARIHELDGTMLEVEAGFPVAEPLTATEGVEIGELPPGRAATTLHTGPYERLSEAAAALDEWVAREGLRVAAAPWFVFWVDPDQVDSPVDLRTELVLPIVE